MNPNLRRRLKYVAPLVVKKVSFENLDRKYVGLEHIESWTGRILYDDLTTLPEGTVSLFEPNDVLFGKLRPYLAKVSLVDFSGACSTEALVLRPKTNQWPPFVRYVLSNGEFIDDVNSSTFGAKMPRASWEFIGSRTVPVPDLPTQKAIADFLDRETARIDQLIEKKQRMISLLQPRWESLFHVGWEDTSKERVRFKFIAIRSQRQIRLEETDEFTPLGLYNRGRGYFKKTPSPGHELGDSTFFWVQEGDLILSGQFAWEGAIALAGEDADGCVVSHRYPVYVGTRGVLTAYLYAYFRTVNGQFLLDNCSRGAAGRNRPLNTNILEREKIPLLPRHIQEEVARLVEQERAIKNVVTASINLLREFRSALITAAVTGQIDVSTWGKQGTTDRRLDQIEEAAST